MFKHRSTQKELLDSLIVDNSALKKNLDEMEILNRWFGSKKIIIAFMKKISNKHINRFKNNKIVIADLGCGNGDLLRAINAWSKKYPFNLDFIGIDNNPSIIQYAIEKSVNHSNIQYEANDIFAHDFQTKQYDIILINSVCHHFDDEQLVKLFKQLKNQARISILINDLQRHWLSYFFAKYFIYLFNFSYLSKNDGPISISRAFRKRELINLLNRANISQYQIRWAWAFRWEILISC